MLKRKYSVILGNLGNTCDRFLSAGYKEQPDKEAMIARAAGIKGVVGVELVGGWDIDSSNVNSVQKQLRAYNLECCSIIVDLFGKRKWGKGAFTSSDAGIRREAIAETVSMINIISELGGSIINIWPGQDGFDYPLATDYLQERKWLLDALEECASHAKAKGISLSLEFKLKEPRAHSYLARTGDALLYARELGDNVGVTIDTGHAFMAYENVGDSIAILKIFGNKLFHMHFNDNYTHWDDDMIVGSIHLVEYFEVLYWLAKTSYAGYLSMDQYPYREDACESLSCSIMFIDRMAEILERVGMDEVGALIARRDPVATSRFIRERLLASPMECTG